jgi:hypothetical protein
VGVAGDVRNTRPPLSRNDNDSIAAAHCSAGPVRNPVTANFVSDKILNLCTDSTRDNRVTIPPQPSKKFMNPLPSSAVPRRFPNAPPRFADKWFASRVFL